MKILVTGCCGFVGSTIAIELHAALPDAEIMGFDSFIRPGSELNRYRLTEAGIEVFHADLRMQSDMDALPKADWVVDAAANASVLAGLDGKSSSRQLVEHNLAGTIHMLEYCRRNRSGFTLLSTSRVYSIEPLSCLAVESKDQAFHPVAEQSFPEGLSSEGVSEIFSTAPPVSLYGATKLSSEILALEYGSAYGFPVWINRCGVLAGAGQFGRPDQGIFSFWIHSWKAKRPLSYIGFNGEGHQVRDCLHPRDLLPVLLAQIDEPLHTKKPRVANFAGGPSNCMSLANLSDWCKSRWGESKVSGIAEERPFDIPWMVLDSSRASEVWDWRPSTSIGSILAEIGEHAEENPDWLDISSR